MGTNRPTLMWKLAAAVCQASACPRCGASPGTKCYSLKERTRHSTSLPHVERYPGGNRNQSDSRNAALIFTL